MGVLSLLTGDLMQGVDQHQAVDAATTHSHHTTSFAEDGGLEFREYYASACPHCKHLQPAWETAKSQYTGGKVTFRAIQCNDENWRPVEENAEMCENIPGFPTLKMFKGDKELDEYEGGRTADDLLSYANNFDESKHIKEKMINPVLGLMAGFSGITGALGGYTSAANGNEERKPAKQSTQECRGFL